MVLYWLSRDSFFENQSIGKRFFNLKVVTLDGMPFNWGKSAIRNIVYLPWLLEMIPFVGWVFAFFALANVMLVELVVVLMTERRIGDHLGNTRVVRA